MNGICWGGLFSWNCSCCRCSNVDGCTSSFSSSCDVSITTSLIAGVISDSEDDDEEEDDDDDELDFDLELDDDEEELELDDSSESSDPDSEPDKDESS